jgi:hypothetical protein
MMTPAARSVRIFAIYLGVLALTLLLAPNVLLQAFRLPPTDEVWIRVVGMLAALLGVYYWVAAATELTPFFRASVLCRLTVPLFFLIFVMAGWARWPLVLFGVIDALGALWTWRALSRSSVAA